MSLDPNEDATRAKIVAEAETWIGTPYVSNALLKGKGGGTDCAMLLIGVYGNLGLIPREFDPRPYAPQWHVHRNEEKYMEYVKQFTKEIPGPPKPGDLVMFKLGRVFAHGGIIVEWPHIIHAIGRDRVMPEDISKNTIGKRALAKIPQRFFSLWSS